MSEPKTIQRRINFRKANRQMTRRRQDIPVEQITPLNTEVLGKFCSETGKILPRRVTGVSAKLHRKINNAIKQSRAINLMP
ncbi:MAG: 30S ribosomal protein S18 [Luteolibacter sp.]|jgi:small subunit ribosomal protein S18|nr:30S ribosomal protein S18 [Akkermansiaceae bacterium]MDP4647710.1 30S ribosomal protein S18 [Akkermansiaceae bacterium]MDP4722229.1 30S ribosomal protein S18 [Akkermansiaceae bacterium]MDP4780270.1 30S ribosomal protein S18 [Akkermansiaceae bacterium]MDP4846247.1 30S ribosomal protein S18 [Akkermansiaceae bacterium]